MKALLWGMFWRFSRVLLTSLHLDLMLGVPSTSMTKATTQLHPHVGLS